MSFREKAAWISLASTAVIWGFYFVTVWGRLIERPGDWPVALFVECVVVSLLVQVALMALVAWRTPPAERALADEREVRIDGRATTVAYAALTVSVLIVALASPLAIGGDLGGIMVASRGEAATVMGQGLLAAIVLAEAVKSGVVILLHRWARA